MIRSHVSLSPVVLDLRHGPYRRPRRPLAIRHTDYEDRFDFTTLYYDCFWNETGTAVELIGPPHRRVIEGLELEFTALPSGAPLSPSPLSPAGHAVSTSMMIMNGATSLNLDIRSST